MSQDFLSAYLVIQKDPQPGKRVELWKECTTIGRSRDCDIFLEDITVHRKQASILCTATSYILRDDHGHGDSLVNGQAVKEHQLSDGDQLLFGNTKLIFHANEGTRPFQLPSSRGHELLLGKVIDPQASAIARLDLTNARTAMRSVELVKEMTIGRSRTCTIFLEDLAVSRLHATIQELPDGHYELIDQHSATGTFVNGRATLRCVLQENDEIQIGKTTFTFRISRS